MIKRVRAQKGKGINAISLASLVTCCALLTACGSVASSSTAAASPTATPRVYVTPPGRQNAAMAYDPELRELIMFGGGTSNAQLSDTWAWDGKGWYQLHPTTVPSTNYAGSLVFDAATRQLLLFTTDAHAFDMWAWKDGNWARLQSIPCCSSGPAQVNSVDYDAAKQRIVMYSGPDTWTWDGKKWADLGSLDTSIGKCFCLAYDSTSRKVLTVTVTGGKFSPAIGHTLTLGPSGWNPTAATTPVTTPDGTMMVDDPASSGVLLLAANDVYGTALPTTMWSWWSWNGSAWQQLNVNLPTVLTGATMAYDPARRDVVLFGGIDAFGNPVNDTWIWDGRSWQKKAQVTDGA